MNKNFIIFYLVLSLFMFTSCYENNNNEINNEIKNDFHNAMNSYQDIWKTKDIKTVEKLANSAFTDKEIVNQIIESHKANIENDQGIDITDRNYNISIENTKKNQAIIKVKATLKGYPISLQSGERKTNKIQDLSFGSHNFEMTKEQGKWKISKF